MTTTLIYPEAPPERGRGARVDGELKVSGQLLYADDLALPGLLYVAVVRSPYPHARIVTWLILFFWVRLPAWIFLGVWFVGQFMLPTGSGVAWMAHVGGFLGGLGLVRLLAHPPPTQDEIASLPPRRQHGQW